ncbi:MAG: Hsp70 family protein [Gemmatimonadaceae bacterium]|jgi:molecular chaperone DnaK
MMSDSVTDFGASCPSHIGIDLGTTFCCQAYIDEQGVPQIIPSAEGERTTPSVLWFDGRRAYAGKVANDKKVGDPTHVYEFVKRDIGKPPDEAPYQIGSYKYGPAGMAALLLRKLKRDALNEFRRRGFVPTTTDERSFRLPVVITVPAYFGEQHRRETMLAGECAGLDVLGTVNEPTAAARAYGILSAEPKRIMVFDLGGGTFDVTLLHMKGSTTEVLSSSGDSVLGGKDWDELIQSFLYESYRQQTGTELDDGFATSFEVQQKALHAKLCLSEQEETEVTLVGDRGEIRVTLKRARAKGAFNPYAMNPADHTFYFAERAADLMARCRRLCEDAMRMITVPTPGGGQRPFVWSDVDEVVLAGGSCRMPMIRDMLREVVGGRLRHEVSGFDYDTAIAIGAALHGQQLLGVAGVTFIDVASHSLGIEVLLNGERVVERLLPKNAPLPLEVSRTYRAPSNAVLFVYEGESRLPDECVLRGRMELGDLEGQVIVTLKLSHDGVLVAHVLHAETSVERILEVKHESFSSGTVRRRELGDKVQSIVLAN